MIPFPKDTKKVVGCDLDDVLADFISAFMKIADERYKSIRNDEYINHDWEWNGLGKTPEDTQTIIDGVWAEILNTENFWEELPIEAGVDPWLVSDLNHKAKVYFPTARAICRGRDVGEQSAYWLRKNFMLPFPTVFVSDQKGPLASALKYDYFIDDRPKNCVEVKKARPECKVFMKTAGHNTGVVLPDIPRIEGFNEFAAIVLRGE
jgi:5'(3')-deoxyribonucleotidase